MHTTETQSIVETDLPERLDRLPWRRFHVLIVVALGITWLLDGLEVTLAGAVASALKTMLLRQRKRAHQTRALHRVTSGIVSRDAMASSLRQSAHAVLPPYLSAS